jgi:hypothetical protein
MTTKTYTATQVLISVILRVTAMFGCLIAMAAVVDRLAVLLLLCAVVVVVGVSCILDCGGLR